VNGGRKRRTRYGGKALASELKFVLNLAREFGRPDWRAMLAGMTSSELGDWHQFYREHYFQDAQLDAHFSELLYSISTLFFRDPELTPAHFSLLSPFGASSAMTSRMMTR
jgi:phage tail assembly protein T